MRMLRMHPRRVLMSKKDMKKMKIETSLGHTRVTMKMITMATPLGHNTNPIQRDTLWINMKIMSK
jgi:hypothetical protein